MPDRLRRSVLAAYRRLGAGPVAVRSSLVGEDSGAASFAGQLDTVLGVDGEPALIDAVRRVLASAYRRPSLGLHEENPRLHPAVIPPVRPFARRRRPVHGPLRGFGRRLQRQPPHRPERCRRRGRRRPGRRPRPGPRPAGPLSSRCARRPRRGRSRAPVRPASRRGGRPRPGEARPGHRRDVRFPRTSSGLGTQTASGSSNPGRSHRSRGAAFTRAGSSPRWPRGSSGRSSGPRNTAA